MISYLIGKVHHKNLDSLTLLVGGVGYLVFVSPSNLTRIMIGDEIELYIHTHVREDALDLYGFMTAEDLALFKLLLGVSGIGCKTALLVLDRGVENVKQAIIKADENFFTLVPRLGKKNAQKIIIELKSKLGSIAELDLTGVGELTGEVIDALLAMGYSRVEALAAVRKLPTTVTSLEDQVRYVLKQGGKNK
jgi:Holliday junction DNA helicase RuvA